MTTFRWEWAGGRAGSPGAGRLERLLPGTGHATGLAQALATLVLISPLTPFGKNPPLVTAAGLR